eukprot:c11681_g1_i1.p1 GENE.c11681_g1_i1~~c11681_g1_i1.p1  ORF type:complete len:372 (+),score=84.20 c11681_g1_i1:55-1170(+)
MVGESLLFLLGAFLVSQANAEHVPLYKCFSYWDMHVTECTKVTIMSSIGIATWLPALWLCISISQTSRMSPQFCILLLVTFQLLFICLHYMFFRDDVVLMFVQHCVGGLALSLVSFFLSVIALRLLAMPYLIRRVVIPLLGTFAVMIVMLLIVGATGGPRDLDCSDPIWLVLSGANAFVSVLLLGIGTVVTRNGRKDLAADWTSRKGTILWILIIGNTISTLLSLSWDIQIHANSSVENCSDPTRGEGSAWMLAWAVHRILTNFIPIWGVLALIVSLPKAPIHNRISLGPQRSSISPHNNTGLRPVLDLEPLLQSPAAASSSRISVSLGAGFSPCDLNFNNGIVTTTTNFNNANNTTQSKSNDNNNGQFKQ